jgi:UDP-N-acetylmuramate--alanine ligase
MHNTIKPINQYTKAYFLGIGGIGMSAIARYLLHIGLEVYGYDKTSTPLTDELISEGATVFFDDDSRLLPQGWIQNPDVLWIITPAIPKEHRAWNYLQSQEINIVKRSEVLGSIARNGFCIAVAGTHGKTTTSTLIAHLLYTCNVNFTAFLGGISANYNSNYIQKSDGKSLVIDGVKKEIIVLEADEFDRSFHRLTPDLAVITAMDPDHLDIYGTEEEFREAFNVFAQLIHAGDVQTSKQLSPRGAGLVLNEKLSKQIVSPQGVELITYGERLESDIHYQQVTITNSNYHFDYCESSQTKVEFQCGLPGFHNIENACAALAITHYFLQLPIEKLQEGIQSFKGAKRRFEYIVRNDNYIVIDDYAHHPEELNAIIRSVKALYPQRPLTGIFQPHLFSRTRDFVDGFADSLSQLDECWLMEIYPAREQPMEGVNSHWLSEKIHTKTTVLNGDQILERLTQEPKELLLILGAGDIDKLVTPIKNIYSVL